jgi:hypothetical protein
MDACGVSGSDTVGTGAFVLDKSRAMQKDQKKTPKHESDQANEPEYTSRAVAKIKKTIMGHKANDQHWLDVFCHFCEANFRAKRLCGTIF